MCFYSVPYAHSIKMKTFAPDIWTDSVRLYSKKYYISLSPCDYALGTHLVPCSVLTPYLLPLSILRASLCSQGSFTPSHQLADKVIRLS